MKEFQACRKAFLKLFKSSFKAFIKAFKKFNKNRPRFSLRSNFIADRFALSVGAVFCKFGS
jgi:hypothetical protein